MEYLQSGMLANSGYDFHAVAMYGCGPTELLEHHKYFADNDCAVLVTFGYVKPAFLGLQHTAVAISDLK